MPRDTEQGLIYTSSPSLNVKRDCRDANLLGLDAWAPI